LNGFDFLIILYCLSDMRLIQWQSDALMFLLQ
jgi:hypothetical protein